MYDHTVTEGRHEFSSGKIHASRSAVVYASGSAVVDASDSARVYAYDSARVEACNCCNVKIVDNRPKARFSSFDGTQDAKEYQVKAAVDAYGSAVVSDATPAKDPNPKDLASGDRAPLALVPDIVGIESSLAYLEGALKYGPYNWRSAPVKATVYVAAIRRHLARYLDGEDQDPKTGVSHLGAAIASCGILLDAKACGTLVDDRPPPGKVGQALDEISPRVKGIREIFTKGA